MELIEIESRNKQQRERIVDSLGGKDFCETIPIISVKYLEDYLKFNIDDIPEGSNIAQYEDNSGRKGILLKLKKNLVMLKVNYFHHVKIVEIM